jgi:hypothetical protein
LRWDLLSQIAILSYKKTQLALSLGLHHAIGRIQTGKEVALTEVQVYERS